MKYPRCYFIAGNIFISRTNYKGSVGSSVNWWNRNNKIMAKIYCPMLLQCLCRRNLALSFAGLVKKSLKCLKNTKTVRSSKESRYKTYVRLFAGT